MEHLDVEVIEEPTRVRLDRLAGRLQDQRPGFVGIIDLLLTAESRRFAGGSRWRRLAPATLARDRRGGRDPRPLIVTGALKRSLTERGAPGQKITVRGDTLRFGTSVYYAIFHQRGSAHPSPTRQHRAAPSGSSAGLRLPRRTVVGLTRNERVEVVGHLAHYILGERP